MGLLQRAANPFIRRALAADHPTRLGRSLMLLTVRGVRTGRGIVLPVQYAREDDTVWVFPGHPEEKTWWRNLRSEAPVRVRLEGNDLTGRGRVVSGEAEPEDAALGLRAYLARFPAARRAVGLGKGADDEAIRTAVEHVVLVRIRLDLPDTAARG